MVFLLLGLAAPFLLIWGVYVVLLWVMFIPVIALYQHAQPFWLRLSKQKRHQILRYTLLATSLLMWFFLIRSSS
jgi:hypothetical protein